MRRIYFAGRIGKNDWRHTIVSGLRGSVETGPDGELFDPEFTIEFDDCHLPGFTEQEFVYGGPFFIACDHGCFHGAGSHGVGVISEGCGGQGDTYSFHTYSLQYVAERRAAIFAINQERLLRADQVFAYLEDTMCYGTLVELGMASALGKPIAIGIARTLELEQRDDLWMAIQTASERVYYGLPQECWAQYRRDHFSRLP